MSDVKALLERVIDLREVEEHAKRIHSEAKKDLDAANGELIALMEDENMKKVQFLDLPKYASLAKPQPYASLPNEHLDSFKSWLSENGLQHEVAFTVHARTLSSFVKRMTEENKKLPDFISVYWKPSLRLLSNRG